MVIEIFHGFWFLNKWKYFPPFPQLSSIMEKTSKLFSSSLNWRMISAVEATQRRQLRRAKHFPHGECPDLHSMEKIHPK